MNDITSAGWVSALSFELRNSWRGQARLPFCWLRHLHLPQSSSKVRSFLSPIISYRLQWLHIYNISYGMIIRGAWDEGSMARRPLKQMSILYSIWWYLVHHSYHKIAETQLVQGSWLLLLKLLTSADYQLHYQDVDHEVGAIVVACLSTYAAYARTLTSIPFFSLHAACNSQICSHQESHHVPICPSEWRY